MGRPDQAIAEIATTQYGLLTRSQARALVSDRMIRHRIEVGRLEVVGPQVLGIAGTPASWHRDVLAACLGTAGFASHQTSARLLGFRRLPGGRIEVTTGLVANHRSAVCTVHQSNAMAPHWTTVVAAIPTMRAARTMVDLAAVLRPKRLEVVLDAALDDRVIDIGAVIDAFDALAVRGRRGIATLRPLLEDRGDGTYVDTTKLERMFSQLLRTAGIEEPRRQVLLGGERLIGLVDFLFPRVSLVVEVDGRRGHSQMLDFERDRRRDQLALTEGLRIVRFTYRQIRDRPDEVVDVMERLLAA
jgi:very-short-patch-repair endonuclease